MQGIPIIVFLLVLVYNQKILQNNNFFGKLYELINVMWLHIVGKTVCKCKMYNVNEMKSFF